MDNTNNALARVKKDLEMHNGQNAETQKEYDEFNGAADLDTKKADKVMKELETLRSTYPTYVFDAIIPRNVDIKDALYQHQDIFAYNPRAKSALAYQKLIRELFNL